MVKFAQNIMVSGVKRLLEINKYPNYEMYRLK